MSPLRSGRWLGIDIGSSRRKVCGFCLIRSDGAGSVEVAFELGSAGDGYPETNTRQDLIDRSRPPTYLKRGVEEAVCQVLGRSELVGRWLEGSSGPRSAVAIDAPVALAVDGTERRTEVASSQPFYTPNRAAFERALAERKDAYLRINVFWKCVGLAVYRYFARNLARCSETIGQRRIAAWTCPGEATPWRLRETFPSDVYKRADGRQGILCQAVGSVLRHLVARPGDWRARGREGSRPAKRTLERLQAIGARVGDGLRTVGPLPEMRKRPGTRGDLWDAFTCAFTACCEDHGGVIFHGMEDREARLKVLHQEGVIMTVRCDEAIGK